MNLAATVTNVQIVPTDGGFLDKLFHGTWVTFNIFGLFDATGGYKITLAGLLVILVLSFAAGAIIERLAGEKPGKGLAAAIIVTLLGAYIFSAFVTLPFNDIAIEGVRLVAALLGGIVFGTFFVLIRKQTAPKKA
jgi:hypothetical protein